MIHRHKITKREIRYAALDWIWDSLDGLLSIRDLPEEQTAEEFEVINLEIKAEIDKIGRRCKRYRKNDT